MAENNEEPTADEIRKTFPTAIAFADHVRSLFGPDVTLLYIKEGDREMGRFIESRGVSLADMVLSEVEPEQETPKPKPHRKKWRDLWTQPDD